MKGDVRRGVSGEWGGECRKSVGEVRESVGGGMRKCVGE